MPTGTTTTTVLSNDQISTYIAVKTLAIAKRNCVFYQFGDKERLPEHQGKTIQFSRYERLPLPKTTLSEGVTPLATQMSVNMVTAVMDQWGSYVTLTDVANLTLAHPVLDKATYLNGVQAAETMDREVQQVLIAGTTVSYGTAAANRASIASGSVLTSTDVKTAVATLRRLGAYEYDAYPSGADMAEVNPGEGKPGGKFVGVMDPCVEMDLTADTTFLAAAEYSNIVALWNGEAGSWMGVRWVRCNNMPVYVGVAAPTVTATTDTAGTLAGTYYVTVTATDEMTGWERIVYQQQTVSVTGGNNAVTLTTALLTTTQAWFNAAAELAKPFTFNVYIGTVTGVTYLYESNIDPATAVTITSCPTSGATPPAAPAATLKVHMNYIFGREAYKVTELAALEAYLTPKGESDSDPLAQRRKCGWKVFFKSCIANQNYLARIEAESAYN